MSPLPIVRCPECGAEILIVPDPRAMGKAVREHAKLHPEKRQKIQDQLIELLLVEGAKLWQKKMKSGSM